MATFELIEDRFAASGRTPKGQRALRDIFRATRDTVSRHGLLDASLDLIADRAGLTQAAVRHYFPTRDELLASFFVSSSEWFQGQIADLLMRDDLPPRDKLERCITWHVEYMEGVETVFWLEASAYWLRHRAGRQVRDDFYLWLRREYTSLIGRIHPAMSPRERERRAYAILTLVLGAWITHGRGSALSGPAIVEQRQLLIDIAMEIASL